MSLIAEKIRGVSPSMTFVISAKARELKSQGVRVFDLSIGEPECGTTENIKQAAYSAIKAEKNKYTPVEGILELRKAICDKYNKRGLSITPDQVIVSSGAKHSLYNCFLATLNKGDEVILPAPYWVSYVAPIELCGGHVVKLNCGEDVGFKATCELIEQSITDKTKWLLLNSPNNPTGAKYSREELKKIAGLLKKYPNLYVLSDDIYEDLAFDGDVCSIIDVAPEFVDRICIVNGISKSYAMPGWRIGYAIGSKELIKSMVTLQSQTTSAPCSISQYTAVEAIAGSQQSVHDYVQVLKNRRDFAYKFFNELPGLSCILPGGAFYVFPNCSKLFGKKSPSGTTIKSDMDFCQYLFEEVKVMVNPGQIFGMNTHFRLSYAVVDEDFYGALNGIKEAVSKLA